MLYLNISRIMSLRAIPNAQKYLIANGFSYNIAFRIMHEVDSQMKFQHMEKLCLILHCTPNDLLSWQPTPSADKNEPLFALVHDTQNVLNKLKNAPIEKLNQFSQWLEQQDENK